MRTLVSQSKLASKECQKRVLSSSPEKFHSKEMLLIMHRLLDRLQQILATLLTILEWMLRMLRCVMYWYTLQRSPHSSTKVLTETTSIRKVLVIKVSCSVMHAMKPRHMQTSRVATSHLQQHFLNGFHVVSRLCEKKAFFLGLALTERHRSLLRTVKMGPFLASILSSSQSNTINT